MNDGTRTVRLGAVLIAAYLALLSLPLRMETAGPVATSALFGLYAADPRLYSFIRGDFEPENPRHGVALLGVISALWLVVLQPLVTLVRLFFLGGTPGFSVGLGELITALAVNVLLLVTVPLAWALLVNDGKPLSESLGLSADRPTVEVAVGVAAAFASLLIVVVVNYLLVTLGGLSGTNPLAERIIGLIDLRTALVISALAAVGEEVFFRGFLQTRIGLLPAALLFSIGHSSYGVATQIVGPLLFGVVLGLVYEWRDSLLAPVVSHFFFNFTVFVAALRFGMGP
ncbi:MAG: hypothetical protein MAG715_00933 [Methanonatronarchaeales archaeon]|nr:hypothetical protein [Methanonatronarchaeales archaeon]